MIRLALITLVTLAALCGYAWTRHAPEYYGPVVGDEPASHYYPPEYP